MVRIRQFLALSGLTAAEAMRQPVFLLLSACCVLLSGLVPLVLLHTFGEDGKLARDSALACHFVFGLFACGYSAGTTLSGELERGTAATVLAKPVSRETLYGAKLAGLIWVSLCFSACALISTLLAERVAEHFVSTRDATGYITDHLTGRLLVAAPIVSMLLAAIANYRNKRPFGSTAFALMFLALVAVFITAACFTRDGAWAPFAFRVNWSVVPVSLCIALALAILSALALCLATRLRTVPVMTLCAAALLLGLISDHAFGRQAAGSGIASVLYRIIPNWQHLWLADALTGGGKVPWHYVTLAGAYAAAYILGLYCVGLLLFRDKEIET